MLLVPASASRSPEVRPTPIVPDLINVILADKFQTQEPCFLSHFGFSGRARQQIAGLVARLAEQVIDQQMHIFRGRHLRVEPLLELLLLQPLGLRQEDVLLPRVGRRPVAVLAAVRERPENGWE